MENWEKFHKRIVVQKPIKEVYQAWTSSSQIEAWFLEKAVFKSDEKIRDADKSFQKGDKFEWKWNNWEFIEEGEILEANGKDLLAFTFGSGGIVRIQLKSATSATEIILTQENIPTDEKSKMQIFVGCQTGWTFWLTNLKAYLEHGITLHAKGLKQEETKDLVNS